MGNDNDGDTRPRAGSGDPCEAVDRVLRVLRKGYGPLDEGYQPEDGEPTPIDVQPLESGVIRPEPDPSGSQSGSRGQGAQNQDE
jgi:hypothetical protein